MKESTIIFGYLLIGLLTFAWIWDGEWEDKYGPGQVFGSAIGGAAWPAYWSIKGSLVAVRAAKSVDWKTTVLCWDSGTGKSWKPVDGECRYPR